MPPREVCNASNRGGGGAQPAVTLPPVLSSLCRWAEWETGSGRSQSCKAFPGRVLLATKHANIHSSEMLKVVTGGQIHEDPPPPSTPAPHAVTLLQTSLTTGKSLRNEKQRKKQKENTQSLRKTSKRSAMYRRNRPVGRDRNNSCVMAKTFSSPRWKRSLCVEPVLLNKLVEAYVPNNFAQKRQNKQET